MGHHRSVGEAPRLGTGRALDEDDAVVADERAEDATSGRACENVSCPTRPQAFGQPKAPSTSKTAASPRLASPRFATQYRRIIAGVGSVAGDHLMWDWPAPTETKPETDTK